MFTQVERTLQHLRILYKIFKKLLFHLIMLFVKICGPTNFRHHTTNYTTFFSYFLSVICINHLHNKLQFSSNKQHGVHTLNICPHRTNHINFVVLISPFLRIYLQGRTLQIACSNLQIMHGQHLMVYKVKKQMVINKKKKTPQQIDP